MEIFGSNHKARDKYEKSKVSYDDLDKLIRQDLEGGPNKAMTELPPPEGWDQTDSVLIECEGWWWLHSNSEKRWRASGKAIVGGKQMCREAKAAFWQLKKSFGPELRARTGNEVPFDLIYKFEPLNLKKFRLA